MRSHHFPAVFTAKDGTKFHGIGPRGRRLALRQTIAHNRSLRRFLIWRSTLTG